MAEQVRAIKPHRKLCPPKSSVGDTHATLPNSPGSYTRTLNGGRIRLPLEDGCIFIISDQHYDAKGIPSVSHRASLLLAKKFRPYAIINNGDTLDLAVASRWPVSSFIEMGERQTIHQELMEAERRLREYEEFDFVKFRVWNLGNHDARFETRLALHVPEYASVSGFTLKERFTGWLPAWRTDIMLPDGTIEVITQHRFKGGMHAGQNNVLWSGVNYVTGHDHMLKTYSITNSLALRWGIHAGTMAPIESHLFLHFTEDRPKNWQEGFPILWFRGGRFIGPELVHCTPDGRAIFRGDILPI